MGSLEGEVSAAIGIRVGWETCEGFIVRLGIGGVEVGIDPPCPLSPPPPG